MKITFVGGVQGVTGSCFWLSGQGRDVIIDCGMFQGRGSDEKNREPFAFDPSSLTSVFVTHSHIDHIGRLPLLARSGFRGRIVATAAAADIAELMLYDAAHIQEADTERENRLAMREGRETREPLYTSEDVDRVLPLIDRTSYGRMGDLGHDIRYRFVDAGHILGSASLEFWYPAGGRERKVVFSGDIGKRDSPVVQDPALVTEADYLVVESTYGSRNHRDLGNSIDELTGAIRDTFRRGGNVIIPAFAVGRTQDLILILNRLVHEGRLFRVNVVIDSPLAEKVTRVYESHPEYFDEEARRLFTSEGTGGFRIRFTPSVEESMALNRVKNETIIIAGSGMCESGRIRHHLKHNLWRPECSVVFVGYQAEGTLGRKIVDGARNVDLLGEKIAVRARVHTLGGFSAHAGRDELIDWVGRFTSRPEVFIVHGEQDASRTLEAEIRQRFGLKTRIPALGETFDLSGKTEP